jgi:branched-chain amino acid transport system substrate-binding protein
MLTNSRLIRSVIVCALVALALATSRARAAGTGDEFPPYAKQVGIVVIAPMTGSEKQYGWDLSAGVQAAINDANRQRGLTDFVWKMASFDDQGDPGVAEQQAQFALVDPSNAIIIGHLGGQETFLALRVYHDAEMPIIVPTSSFSALTLQGYDNVFRMCAPDTLEGALDARYVERNLKPKKAAVIWEENDYGNSTATNFMNYAAGGQKLKASDYSVDVDLKNLKQVIAKVSADAPDFLYVTGRGDLMAKVLVALRKAGVTAPVLGSAGFYSDELLKDKDFKSAADGMLVSTCVPPVQFMPSAQVFQQRFQSEHGRLSAYALFGYASAQVAINAAVQARTSDKHALIRQLSNDVFRTVIGDVSFRANGDPSSPNLYFYRIDSGSFKYVGSSLPNPAVLR